MKTLKICIFALVGMIFSQSCQNFYSTNKKSRNEAKNVPANVDIVEVRLRYKPLKEDKSELFTQRVSSSDIKNVANSSADFKLSAAVAAWDLMLDSKLDKNEVNFKIIENLAKEVAGNDIYKLEFVKLVALSKSLALVK